MRASFCLLLLGAVAAAQAQTVVIDTSTDDILQAYNRYRVNESLKFELSGFETYGAVRTPLYAVLYWQRMTDRRTGTQSAVRLEMDVYDMTRKEAPVVLRLVGDGVNLYRYDMARREVSTTVYGFTGTTPPPGWPGADGPKLAAQLRAAAPGPYAWLARLVAEINPSGDKSYARFAEWVPAKAALAFDSVPVPIRHPSEIDEASYVLDPVTGARTFVKGSPKSTRYTFYGMDGRATDRTATFTFYDARTDAEKQDDPDNPRWEVQTVNVAQRSPNRLLDLTLTPGTTTIPSLVPYTSYVPFVPFTSGFRPISATNH